MDRALAPSGGAAVEPGAQRPALAPRLARARRGVPGRRSRRRGSGQGVAAQRHGVQQRRSGLCGPGRGYRRPSGARALFPVFRAHPLLFQSLLSVGFELHLPDGFERPHDRRPRRGDGRRRLRARAAALRRPAGLIAARLMALMPYHVIVTRQVLLDGPKTFFATITLSSLIRFVRCGRRCGCTASARPWDSRSSRRRPSIVFSARSTRSSRSRPSCGFASATADLARGHGAGDPAVSTQPHAAGRGRHGWELPHLAAVPPAEPRLAFYLAAVPRGDRPARAARSPRRPRCCAARRRWTWRRCSLSGSACPWHFLRCGPSRDSSTCSPSRPRSRCWPPSALMLVADARRRAGCGSRGLAIVAVALLVPTS